MSATTKAAVVVLMLVLAAAGAHALDRSARAAVVSQFAWSKAFDLEQVTSYEPGDGKRCAPESTSNRSRDEEALVRALITVESLATPRLEAWWKAALVRMAARLDLPIPDLTYGPGRVRLSMARAVIRAHAALGAEPSEAELAGRLLDYCGSKQIVAAMVAELTQAQGGGAETHHLDLSTVRRVARIYNGQAEPTTAEAAVAHATYNALVYALFQRYRFESLSD